MLTLARKMKNALVWANETVQDYATKLTGKDMLMAEKIVKEDEPESERLLAAVCAKGKALVLALGMIRE